jgi:hypothetical protein
MPSASSPTARMNSDAAPACASAAAIRGCAVNAIAISPAQTNYATPNSIAFLRYRVWSARATAFAMRITNPGTRRAH